MVSITWHRDEVEKLFSQAADVEIYYFTESDRFVRGIHTDSIEYIDNDISILPEEFTGQVELMDEEDYHHSVEANCQETEFIRQYGTSEAKVLVIVLDHDWFFDSTLVSAILPFRNL